VNDIALRTHPELLVDSRGHALRATWHPDDREVVLGVWNEHRCVGTVRLDPPAAARLGAFLVAALGSAVSEPRPTLAFAREPESVTDKLRRLRDRWRGV
jgi:hypothetical protein